MKVLRFKLYAYRNRLVPMFVLVCLVVGLQLPSWLGLVLMVWFVGGFVYLVASMRPDQRDGYDDGAVL